jgi:CubicO group peptidase (beta-lactamase class C family)
VQKQVDAVFAKWDSAVSPGCALSMIKDGQIIYKHGYGLADLDHDIPITPETVFHVASVSKQFTAMAVLLLAQAGKLSLDDDVRQYIPEVPDFGARITIRNLIYHTSGLRDQWDLLNLAGWRYSLDLITDDDVLGLVARQKELNFPPGEKQLYSNTGYTLLGQIVKRVSGQSLHEFTTERIFTPLGMSNTHFRDDHAEIVKHMAYGYIEGPAGKGYRLSVTNFDTVGPTSLLTTVEDLALWDENFYHPRVGGAALVEQQLQRGKLNNAKDLDYASGLGLGEYRGLPTVDHPGTDAGYRAELLRFPEQHFSVACLCNDRSIFPVELARKVADIYLAGQFHDAAEVQPVSSVNAVVVPLPKLTEYAGLYWDQDDLQVQRAVLRNGKLFAAGLELMPLTESRFRLAIDASETYTFEKSSDGSHWRMTIQDTGDAPEVYDQMAQFRPSADQLAGYAGSYASEEIDPVYRIAAEDGGLVLRRLKASPQKLRPIVADYFQGLDGLGGVIHFERNADGEVTGFVVDSDGIRNFRFAKKPM